jgi:hypothetical protein
VHEIETLAIDGTSLNNLADDVPDRRKTLAPFEKPERDRSSSIEGES